MTASGVCLGRPLNSCLLELLVSIPAASLVAIWIICSLPITWPKFIRKPSAFVAAPFLPTLTVKEAEQLDIQFAEQDATHDGKPPVQVFELPVAPSWWRAALLVALPGIELAGWTVVAIYNLVQFIHHDSSAPFAFLPWTPFLVALTWGYAFVRTLHRPPITPPYDVFILSIFYFFETTYKIYNVFYSAAAEGVPLPSQIELVALGVHIAIVSCLLLVIFSLPLNVRRYPVIPTDKLTPTPEDYTTLAGWALFSWVNPLVSFKNVKKLEYEDIWDLSPTLKTRHSYQIFTQTPGSRLLLRLIRANSLDLIIDLVFTQVSLLFDFAGPFFLQRILDDLENPTIGSRQRLYGYAFATFFANCLKAESDLQHLWYSRRAASRVGTQLSAAIYDKALRIIDQSGIVDKKAGEEGKTAENDGQTKAGKDTTPSKADGKEEEESQEEESNASVGKIVNILAIDARRLQDQIITMSMIYNAPVQLLLSCLYLYSILGWAAFVGFLPLLVSVPLSKVLADAVGRIQKSLMAAKDKRMKMIDEMFGSIKFIKFFAWEEQWIAKIIKARMVEMKYLRQSRTVNVMYSLLWIIVPNMVSVLSFLTFIMTGHKLSVSVAFTAIRLFDMLRQPLGVLPYALITFTQTKVSLGRILNFLDVGEVPSDVFTPSRPATTEPEELVIENANFKWSTSEKKSEADKPASKPSHKPQPSETTVVGDDAESEVAASTSTRTAVGGAETTFELRNITVRLAKGKLTVVTGPTASGKTALLLALLGEMDRISGTGTTPKNPSIVGEHGLRNAIAFAAQTPWLQQMSIKDNIVFEYPFDEARYDAVLEACALKPDLRALEDGDMTEIGAKGVSLSGGQKARVALARAVYAPTQYLILDDIFSAVDSHTARFLFERLLKGPLLANRTVVLVTHHVELVLPGTHYLIQMSEGRIERQGTVAELKEQKLLDFIAHDPSMHPESNDESAETVDPEATDNAGPPKQARKLVEEEERSEGTVKWSVYKTYMKASSYWTWVIVLILILLNEGTEIGTRVWMSIWGSAYAQPSLTNVAYSVLSFSKDTVKIFSDPLTSQHYHVISRNDTFQTMDIQFPNANEHPLFYVLIYCGLGVLSAVFACIGEWVLLTGGMRSGMVLFRDLLSKLSSATFRFFDTTPLGRILNRFGKDFETIDGSLPFMLYHVTTSVASFVGAVVTVIFVIPFFAPMAFIIAFVYVRLSIGYLTTGRDLRRMESTTRSPILASFSDLVNGIITVRAFSAERGFLHRHFKRVDTSQRFWYYSWMLNRWLLLRFDVLGAVSVLAATIFVISGYIPVGYAALTIVSAMTFSMSVYWTCRAFTELELNLNSVERVVEFLDVPQEPLAVVEKNRVPAYWPSSSDSNLMLVVENLEVKYAPDLPSVLHDISFSLKARERVGLLGRTGCGKSTLAMSLLRFVEPAKGKIIVDGIDITTIGTQDLRSRITFIPQDATLFAGTIRENLDPFDEHTDTECLDALARVHLITSISQMSSRAPSPHSDNEGSTTPTPSEVDGKVIIKLDSPVTAGGNNFSNGQRQLLAMARALLRQSAVVVLDEATSSIDKAADMKIQAVIREEFNRSLLLTIAHRLGTIIDYDRLVVLDKGRIAEIDTPWNLIRKEGGVFREMCLQSGTYAELELAAKAHAEAAGTV